MYAQIKDSKQTEKELMRSSFTSALGKPGMLVAAPSKTLIPKPLKNMIGVHHCSIEFKGNDRMRERYPVREAKKSLSVITVNEDTRSSSSSDHLQQTLHSIGKQLNVELKY